MSPDCAGGETKAALQELAARTGFQMVPDDPMRPAAAQMELALTKMLRAHDEHMSTAATATQKLIERLQVSAGGPAPQRN